MPIEVNFHDLDNRIVVINMIGVPTAQDVDDLMKIQIIPYVQSQAPEHVHLIFDVTNFNWTFQDFARYLGMAKERHNREGRPKTVHQHFVGSNAWVSNLRSWWQKHYDDETTVFTNLDDALNYIHDLKTVL